MATASSHIDLAPVGLEPSTKMHFGLKRNETLKDVFKMPRFDPAVHLAFTPPTARHSFTELGLTKPANAPDICFTEPFQLFSAEGVRMLRREIFRKEFLDKYMRSWGRAPCYIGGHSNHPNVSILLSNSQRPSN